ncbi:kinetochore complex Sim4 subunit Fta1-domain-containing protein [Xylariales sp. AK1849]|nr:kinetochore complex Sim4 subunit Fta1-domain-containing protein [Xylariales sp. AK1849]
MPPKRKRQPEPSPTHYSDPKPEADAPEPPSFFNATFSPHRVSPLHIGETPLSRARLATLSRRLRDTLVGDVVRGVQVGLGVTGDGDATLGRAGALEDVDWRWVGIEQLLGNNPSREGSADLGGNGDEGEGGGASSKALSVELRYENSVFSALMLPEPSKTTPSANEQWTSHPTISTRERSASTSFEPFAHLPLLLLRMPAPLKSVIVDFFCRTFDCRISPLRLGTRTLVSSWEGWLANSGVVNRGALSKDVGLTLGFYTAPEPRNIAVADGEDGEGRGKEQVQLGLKAIDIIIPAEEVSRFVRTGEQSGERNMTSFIDSISPSRRRRLADGKDEEGWTWRYNGTSPFLSDNKNQAWEQPFTEALYQYLLHNLALELFHPGVRILRIACDCFILSEKRIKIFAPSDAGDSGGGNTAVWRLVDGLAKKARRGLEINDASAM